MGKTKITIMDIAREANVSKTVVSNYLNGRSGTMSKDTRERIRQIIEMTGYTPNDARRNFKRKPTGMIGLIIPDITDSFVSMLCKGISDAGFAHNYSVIMANTDNNILRENTYIKSMEDKIDGLIISSVGNNEQALSTLQHTIPIVSADRKMKTLKCDIVASNNYEAVQELMQYLSVLGYEEFALFTERPVDGAARTIRQESYLDFVRANKLESSSSIHIIDINDEKTAMKELSDFMSRTNNRKRVIFAVNGRTLLQTIAAVQSMGLVFPENIGVCGYDDFEWASIVRRGITTIFQPTYEMGYRCVEQLVKRIREGNDAPEQSEIILHSKLMIRGSL